MMPWVGSWVWHLCPCFNARHSPATLLETQAHHYTKRCKILVHYLFPNAQDTLNPNHKNEYCETNPDSVNIRDNSLHEYLMKLPASECELSGGRFYSSWMWYQSFPLFVLPTWPVTSVLSGLLADERLGLSTLDRATGTLSGSSTVW